MHPNTMMEATEVPSLTDIMGADNMSVDQYGDYNSGATLFDDGIYPFTIDKAELKKTKQYATNGGGMFVSLMFRHNDSNGVLFNNYNIVNKNPEVAGRAKAELAAIAREAGLSSIPDDTPGFEGLQVALKLSRKQTRDSLKAMKVNPMTTPEYENNIDKYLPVNADLKGTAADSTQGASKDSQTLLEGPPTTGKPPAGMNLPNFG